MGKKPTYQAMGGEDTVAKALLKQYQAMKSERRVNERYYLAASKMFDPKIAMLWCNDTKERKELENNSTLYTSVGVNSIRRNTNFFMSNATPETGSWWAIGTANADLMQDQGTADWANAVTKIVQAQQRKSLYVALRKAYREMFISYGMIYQGIRRDRGKSQREVVYEHVPSHSIWFRKNLYGEIFQAAWSRSMSADAFYEEYGVWPKGYRSEAERKNKRSRMVSVVVFVMRNKQVKESPTKAADHEYVEQHVEVDDKKVIDTRGHDFMPFYEIPMGDAPNSDYPVGVAYDALSDAMGANVARKTQMQAMAFAGRPVLLTSTMDAVSSYGKQLRPGGLIEGGLMGEDGKPSIAPLQGLFQPEVFQYAVAEDEARVRDTLMQNELIQSHSDDMTATAARIVAAERAALVAPFINNIMPALTRLCENHIKVLAKFEQLPPVPAALAEADMEISITSPMAMQASMHDVAALQESINYLGMVMQIDPLAGAALDVPDALKTIAEATGTQHIYDLGKYTKAVKNAQKANEAAQAQAQQATEAKTENMQADTLGKVAEVAPNVG